MKLSRNAPRQRKSAEPGSFTPRGPRKHDGGEKYEARGERSESSSRDKRSRDGKTGGSKPGSRVDYAKADFARRATKREDERGEAGRSGARDFKRGDKRDDRGGARTDTRGGDKRGFAGGRSGKPSFSRSDDAKPAYRGDGERKRFSRDTNSEGGYRGGEGRGRDFSKKDFDRKNAGDKPYGKKDFAKKDFGGKPFGKKRFDKDFKSDRPERSSRPERPAYAERPDRAQKTYKPRGEHRGESRGDRPEKVQREVFDEAARGTTLIWGLHAVRAAWLNPKRRCLRLWLTENGQKSFEATIEEAKEALLKRPDAKICERTELDRLTPPASVHQGILMETAPLPEPSLSDIIGGEQPPALLLMLDQVTDPHNVGAILRSAAAFGAGAVIMTERNAPGTTGVLAKSASGAVDHLPLIHVVNLARAIDDLHEAGYWCIGLGEEGARDLHEADLSGRTVLVLGAEGDGLRQLTRKKCDEMSRLPTGGAIGSLNVSNAAAVALYEARRQKSAAKK